MQILNNIGATALRAYSTQVDTVANNIANVNTRDYTRQESVFSGLVSTALSKGVTPYLEDGNKGQSSMVTPRHVFQQPGLQPTDNPLDMALAGDGFFRLEMDGQVFYSNRGEFNLDAQGNLVHSSGAVIPDVQLPHEGELQVDNDGQAWLINPDGDIEMGSLEVVTFANPQGLEHIGGGCFVASAASGEPEPDTEAQVRQGYRKLPSVDLAEEMTRLIMAQRAYQVNAGTIRTADEMWQRINTLKR